MDAIKVLLFMAFLAIAVLVYTAQKPQLDELDKTVQESSPASMGFPPLILCQQTGGDWKNVSSAEYPLNGSEGIYNPTTNPNVNYKCFCPSPKNWNPEIGCE